MRGLILDFDGTMVDSETVLLGCIVDALAARGRHVAVADLLHLVGRGGGELADEWQRICGPDYSLADLEADVAATYPPLADALPLLPGVLEVLDAAMGLGWKVGLGTMRRRASLDRGLEALGIADRFHATVTADDVERGKPAPDVFLEVARRLEVDPADCLVIEDSVHGAHAAIAAGMDVVVCPSAATAASEFPPAARRVANLLEVAL